MNLRVLDEADADANEAANWYEDRSLGLGYDFHAELGIAFGEIQSDPFRHPKIELLKIKGDVRRYLLERFPYFVAFQIFDEEILILAVAHGSRDKGFWGDRIR